MIFLKLMMTRRMNMPQVSSSEDSNSDSDDLDNVSDSSDSSL